MFCSPFEAKSFEAEEHHAQAADAARRGHAMFEWERTRLACRVPRPRGTHERGGQVHVRWIFPHLTPTCEGAGRNTRGACAPQGAISCPLMQHSKTTTVDGSSGESLASGTNSFG